MNFQQTIFLNNANAAASKGKTQSVSKQSGKEDFYKIIQNISSSQRDKGIRQSGAANSSAVGSSGTNTEAGQISSSTDFNAVMSDTNDLIDEDVINQAIGASSPVTQTEKTDGEAKFSMKDIKALLFDRKILEEISAEFNIPMEVIDAFLSQFVLQSMGGETMPDEIPAILNAVINPDETVEAVDIELNLPEESVREIRDENFTKEFIDQLKKFVEMSDNDRTAQKYSDLNEFVDAVMDAEVNAAARRAVRPSHLFNNFSKAEAVTNTADEMTDFVTEKILGYLNIDADSLSDLEIVSIEKLLNENVTENDNFTALLQKLRNPWTSVMASLREAVTEAPETVENPVVMEEAELIPVNINTAEIENISSETDVAESYEPAVITEEDPVNIEMMPGTISDNTAEIKQYPDVIAHYTRAANSIQNLILNNKSGENFQVKMLLRPEGLGEMIVRVTYNKGNISLNITTDNAIAQKELANQSSALRNSLAEHDFNLMNFDVGNKNPDDRRQYEGEESGKKNKNRASKMNGINSGIEENPKISGEDIIRLRNIYQNRILYKQV